MGSLRAPGWDPGCLTVTCFKDPALTPHWPPGRLFIAVSKGGGDESTGTEEGWGWQAGPAEGRAGLEVRVLLSCSNQSPGSLPWPPAARTSAFGPPSLPQFNKGAVAASGLRKGVGQCHLPTALCCPRGTQGLSLSQLCSHPAQVRGPDVQIWPGRGQLWSGPVLRAGSLVHHR